MTKDVLVKISGLQFAEDQDNGCLLYTSKQRRSRFIYKMHTISHPENWGMVLDINMHMIIRIIMWSSNICRTD